jgi:hypothetical protein
LQLLVAFRDLNPKAAFGFLARDYPEEEVALDGRSRMTVYNDVMTVQQLIDLVAFLQSHYQVVPPRCEFHSYQS